MRVFRCIKEFKSCKNLPEKDVESIVGALAAWTADGLSSRSSLSDKAKARAERVYEQPAQPTDRAADGGVADWAMEEDITLLAYHHKLQPLTPSSPATLRRDSPPREKNGSKLNKQQCDARTHGGTGTPCKNRASVTHGGASFCRVHAKIWVPVPAPGELGPKDQYWRNSGQGETQHNLHTPLRTRATHVRPCNPACNPSMPLRAPSRDDRLGCGVCDPVVLVCVYPPLGESTDPTQGGVVGRPLAPPVAHACPLVLG